MFRKLAPVLLLSIFVLLGSFGCQGKTPGLSVNSTGAGTSSTAKGDARPAGPNSLKALYGIKVVCFGDSIIGMCRDSSSVVSHIADITGATCYNAGFGGTRWSAHPTAGYSAFSMYRLAEAVATGDWTQQDAEAASGSSYFPEQLAMLKTINFSDVDAIILHFGTNDFTGSSHIDNKTNKTDTETICGAMRHSLNTLITAYPHIKVFISLPTFRVWTVDGEATFPSTFTNGNGNTLIEVIEAIRGVAKEYNLPIIDGYYALGVNALNYAQHLSDGVHHNELGRMRLGSFIASTMMAEY